MKVISICSGLGSSTRDTYQATFGDRWEGLHNEYIYIYIYMYQIQALSAASRRGEAQNRSWCGPKDIFGHEWKLDPGLLATWLRGLSRRVDALGGDLENKMFAESLFYSDFNRKSSRI